MDLSKAEEMLCLADHSRAWGGPPSSWKIELESDTVSVFGAVAITMTTMLSLVDLRNLACTGKLAIDHHAWS